MSYEKRKEKRKRNKNIKKIIIILIILYFVINSLLNALNLKHKTVMPMESMVEKSIEATGIIMKNEKVYSTDIEIDKMEMINEGKRVPVGYEVTNIYLIDEIEDLKAELGNIEDAIEYNSLSIEEKEHVHASNDKLLSEQSSIIESIQDNIADQGKVRELKLKYLDNKKNIKYEDLSDQYINLDLDSLNNRRRIISEKIKNNTISYTTDVSGIISYNLDGFEKKLNPENFDKIDFKTFEQMSSEEKEKKINDKELDKSLGFKVVDNYYWYIAITMDNDDMKKYEENSLITIRIEDSSRDLVGKIVSINKRDEDNIILVRFNNYLEEFYNMRFVNLNIIESKSDGYKIPVDTITEKGKQTGVYIKKFNGIVVFRPVELIKKDGEYAYIKKSENGYIQLKDGEDPVQTIGPHDDIILKPGRVTEGEIIN